MKLKYFVFSVAVILIVVLQNTLLQYIEILHVKPNLILVVVVSFALLYGNIQGAIAGFILGLCQDITSGSVIGFYALLGLYLGLVVGIVNKRLYRENFIVIIFFTFISTIAYEALVYLLNEWGVHMFSSVETRVSLLYAAKNNILPEAVYNCIVAVPIYVITMILKDKFNSAGKTIRRY
jgi:rod shape-determining protein MreD